MMHNVIVRTALLLHVIFVFLVVALPIEYMRLIAATFMTSLSLLAASAWLPDAWRQVRLGKIDTERITLIAIAITSLGLAGFGVYSLVFNLLDRPAWLTAMPIFVYLQLVVAFGQFLLTADPVKPKGQLHSWNMWFITVAFVAAIMIGVTIGVIGMSIATNDMMQEPFRYW